MHSVKHLDYIAQLQGILVNLIALLTFSFTYGMTWSRVTWTSTCSHSEEQPGFYLRFAWNHSFEN